MMNRDVYRAVSGAVYQAASQAVYRAVGGAGNVAEIEAEVVPRAVFRAVYRAADEGGAVAPHKALPHPGLGLYLGAVT